MSRARNRTFKTCRKACRTHTGTNLLEVILSLSSYDNAAHRSSTRCLWSSSFAHERHCIITQHCSFLKACLRSIQDKTTEYHSNCWVQWSRTCITTSISVSTHNDEPSFTGGRPGRTEKTWFELLWCQWNFRRSSCTPECRYCCSKAGESLQLSVSLFS